MKATIFRTTTVSKIVSITQFGLQRSGTNFTRLLLMRNYHADIPPGQKSWKHGFYQSPTHHPVSFDGETHVIVTVKNPFAWLLSIYNYSPYFKDVTFSTFLTTKYAFEGLANINPVVHWNTMHNHWLSLVLKNHEVAYIRYEDLLIDPQMVLDEEVVPYFQLKRKSNDFYVPQKEVLRDTKEGTKDFNKDYYLEEKYLSKYSLEDMEWVISQLDRELFKRLYPEMCKLA